MPLKPENPVCPQCDRPMKVKHVMPVLFASKVDDIVYGCDDCGTEAKRTVKRA
jgi:RNase P subunit RPR2